jgi:transposase-like protein
VGVAADSHREIHGLIVASAKDRAAWLAFQRSLITRSWQRCRALPDAPKGCGRYPHPP